jgi:hypothetical protein
MNAMDINPRPKLIVTLMKSMVGIPVNLRMTAEESLDN